MNHMRIIVTRYGGPDALQAVEEARPEPQPGEVRVRVLAAGVSLPDVMYGVGGSRPARRLTARPRHDVQPAHGMTSSPPAA